jgi:FkbM family methyltransferase
MLSLCALLLPTALALAITPQALSSPTSPREARLHLPYAWAETATSSCRSLPYTRAYHGEHARFWHPHELDALESWVQQQWFNTHERAFGDVFHYVLDPAVRPQANYSVLDVGSNTGWYSAFAAGRGYPVVSIDMLAECARRSRCGSIANLASQLVEIHHAFATDDAGVAAGALRAQGAHCFSGTSAAWRDSWEWPGFTELVQPLQLGRLLAARGRRVAIAKIDIEGGEVAVVRSLAQGNALQLIDHLLVEFSPHMWAALNITTTSEGVGAFAPLFAAGFTAVDLPEGYTVHPPSWAACASTGPGLEAQGSCRKVVSTADLALYAEGVMRATAVAFRVFTLWFSRL